MARITVSTTEDEKRFGGEFLEEIINWIAYEYDPDDIFDPGALAEWAENNGWTEEV